MSPPLFVIIVKSLQVARESKLRREMPGSAWTDAYRQQTYQEHFDFIRNRERDEENESKGVAKKAKMLATGERLAAYDVGRTLENMLLGHNGMGLERFLDNGDPGRMLILTMDWEQKQWCLFWYLRNFLKLMVEAVPDVEHVRHRNLEAATDDSGFRLTANRRNVMVNVAYGPWNGSGFMNEITETTAELSRNMEPNDPLLLNYWPRIMQDLELPPSEDNARGRTRYLETLPSAQATYLHGPKASTKRWCSGHLAGRWHDAYHSTKCVVIGHLGVKRKWVDSIEDLSTVQRPRKKKRGMNPPGEPDNGNCNAGGVGVVAAGSAGRSSGDPPVPKAKAEPKSKSAAASKRSAKQKTDSERSKCINTLHYVLKLVNDSDFIMSERLVRALADPEVDEHSRYLKDVLGPDEQMEFMADMANGYYTKPICEAISVLGDTQKLSRCGFICEPMAATGLTVQSANVMTEDARAHQALDYLFSYMLRRTASCAWHSHSYPSLSAIMCHSNAEIRSQGLTLLKEYDGAWEWSQESGSPKGRWISQRSMLHGRLMVAMVRLARLNDFDGISPELLAFLNCFWSGLLQSVINERANKILRDAETRASTSKDVARLRRWELLRRSGLLQHYKVAVKEPSEHIAVPSDISLACIFKAVGDTFSVDLKSIQSSTRDWQTWNSTTIKDS